jgi:hypothetical protein
MAVLPLPKKDELMVYTSDLSERIVIALNTGSGPFRIYSSNFHHFTIEIVNHCIIEESGLAFSRLQSLTRTINTPGTKFKVVNCIQDFSTELLPAIKVYNLMNIPWINSSGEILI